MDIYTTEQIDSLINDLNERLSNANKRIGELEENQGKLCKRDYKKLNEDLKKYIDKNTGKTEEHPLVPKNIKIEDYDNFIGIVFGDRVLSGCANGDWFVGSSTDTVQCKLVPCERSDLKTGDIAFRGDSKNPDFGDLEKYCLIIDSDKHRYVKYDFFQSDYDVQVSNVCFRYWWRVERV